MQLNLYQRFWMNSTDIHTPKIFEIDLSMLELMYFPWLHGDNINLKAWKCVYVCVCVCVCVCECERVREKYCHVWNALERVYKGFWHVYCSFLWHPSFTRGPWINVINRLCKNIDFAQNNIFLALELLTGKRFSLMELRINTC